jgi:hypothetical protein
MSKPFNLAEAKQGKPYKSISTNQIYSYIGMTKDGKIVSENKHGNVIVHLQCELEMITTKKTYYANLYFDYDQPTVGPKYPTHEGAVNGVEQNCWGEYVKTIDFEVEE